MSRESGIRCRRGGHHRYSLARASTAGWVLLFRREMGIPMGSRRVSPHGADWFAGLIPQGLGLPWSWFLSPCPERHSREL